jgi:hypothetical protein
VFYVLAVEPDEEEPFSDHDEAVDMPGLWFEKARLCVSRRDGHLRHQMLIVTREEIEKVTSGGDLATLRMRSAADIFCGL